MTEASGLILTFAAGKAALEIFMNLTGATKGALAGDGATAVPIRTQMNVAGDLLRMAVPARSTGGLWAENAYLN